MSDAIAGVVEELGARQGTLPSSHLGFFLATYQRTTAAVGKAVAYGSFEDPEWVERWDVVFAGRYLHALDAYLAGDMAAVPRPWRLAFDAPATMPALRHLLLGINAHVNYDLPLALLAAIPPQDFDDAVLRGRRKRDHERIDAVLAGRVGPEDDRLAAQRRPLDRALRPLNRLASRRFLTEARRKVWHNAGELHAARMTGPETLRSRTGELELLSAARLADLLEPGPVLLRLGVGGFGVVLPP